MYIMCVCLFSALSRRVGALQISIFIIIIIKESEALAVFSYNYYHTQQTTSNTTATQHGRLHTLKCYMTLNWAGGMLHDLELGGGNAT